MSSHRPATARCHHHRHLRAGHQPRPGAGAGAEPRRDRRAAAAARGAHDRRHDPQELARPADGGHLVLAGSLAQPAVHQQLRRAAAQRPAVAGPGRRRCPTVRRARLQHADLDRPGSRGVAQSHGRRLSLAVARRMPRSPPARVGQPPFQPGGTAYQLDIQAQGRLSTRRNSATSSSSAISDGGLTRLRDVARVELGALDYSINAYLDQKPAVASASPAPGSNALATARCGEGGDEEGRRALSAGHDLSRRLQSDRVHPRLDLRGEPHAGRGDGAGRAGRAAVPAELARGDHPDRRHPGLAARRGRGDGGRSASRSTI